MKPKDPLVALMLAFLFPGLGQIYSGRAARGAGFMMVHLSFLGVAAAFMFHLTMETNRYFLLPVLFFAVFEVFVVIDAYLYTKKVNLAFRRPAVKKILIPLGVVFFMFVVNGNTLLVLAMKRYIAPVARVRSNSMRPRLMTGDWFLIDKMVYRQRSPRPGDVVFFDFHLDERVVVKRVVASGGEMVEIRGGDIYIDGRIRDIPGAAAVNYLNAGEFGRAGEAVFVPPGYYFVLRDNTEISIDSRYWGFVPAQNIIGCAHKIIYPFYRSSPVE